MKKGNTINRNRQPLSEQDIQKGAHFDTFLKAYQARKIPFYKKNGFYLSTTIIIAIIGFAIYVLVEKEVTPQSNKALYMNLPIAGIDIEDTIYQIDASSGSILEFSTGSIIEIPSNAFIDAKGNIVTGNVELHYREFHDPESIFIAGISMVYDSAGRRYHFESAGMLEITAWKNGIQLFANPSQSIHIAMNSNTAIDRFNTYYLDTLKSNWKFIGKDKLISATAPFSDSDPSVIALKTMAPLQPRLANSKKPSFSIDFDPVEFPELVVYKGVRFEVDEKITPYNRLDRKIQWDDVSVQRNNDGQSLTIRFTKDTLQRAYSAYIVVDALNYKKAEAEYQVRLERYRDLIRYNKNKTSNQQQINREIEDVERRLFLKKSSALQQAIITRHSQAGNAVENQIMRLFVIEKFGIWNSGASHNHP